MAELQLLIGDKGAGKTTRTAYRAQFIHANYPHLPVVSNTPIWWENVTEEDKIVLKEYHEREYEWPKRLNGREFAGGAHLRRESFKWLAIKTILKDRRYAYMVTDEAALAEDLESRGSHAYETAPKTYLVALSRKTNIDLDVISQMISMTDKRVQWLADVPVLCTGHYYADVYPKRVDFFEYQLYGTDLKTPLAAYDLGGSEAYRWIFPRFDTNDVPLNEDRIRQWVLHFDLSSKDSKGRATGELDPLLRKDFEADMTAWADLAKPGRVSEIAERWAKDVDVTSEDTRNYNRDMGPA